MSAASRFCPLEFAPVMWLNVCIINRHTPISKTTGQISQISRFVFEHDSNDFGGEWTKPFNDTSITHLTISQIQI